MFHQKFIDGVVKGPEGEILKAYENLNNLSNCLVDDCEHRGMVKRFIQYGEVDTEGFLKELKTEVNDGEAASIYSLTKNKSTGVTSKSITNPIPGDTSQVGQERANKNSQMKKKMKELFLTSEGEEPDRPEIRDVIIQKYLYYSVYKKFKDENKGAVTQDPIEIGKRIVERLLSEAKTFKDVLFKDREKDILYKVISMGNCKNIYNNEWSDDPRQADEDNKITVTQVTRNLLNARFNNNYQLDGDVYVKRSAPVSIDDLLNEINIKVAGLDSNDFRWIKDEFTNEGGEVKGSVVATESAAATESVVADVTQAALPSAAAGTAEGASAEGASADAAQEALPHPEEEDHAARAARAALEATEELDRDLTPEEMGLDEWAEQRAQQGLTPEELAEQKRGREEVERRAAEEERRAAEEERRAAEEAEEAQRLREELGGMLPSALKKRAKEAGVDEEKLEAADDVDDTKAVVIELLIEAEQAKKVMGDLAKEDGDAAARIEAEQGKGKDKLRARLAKREEKRALLERNRKKQEAAAAEDAAEAEQTKAQRYLELGRKAAANNEWTAALRHFNQGVDAVDTRVDPEPEVVEALRVGREKAKAEKQAAKATAAAAEAAKAAERAEVLRREERERRQKEEAARRAKEKKGWDDFDAAARLRSSRTRLDAEAKKRARDAALDDALRPSDVLPVLKSDGGRYKARRTQQRQRRGSSP